MKHSRLIILLLLAVCCVPVLAKKKKAPEPPAVTESDVWFEDITRPAGLSETQGVALVRKLRTGLQTGRPVKELLADLSYDDVGPRVLFLTLGDGIYPGRTYYASGSSFQDALGRLLAIVAKREPEYAEAMKAELEGQVRRAKEEYENMTEKQRRKAPPNPLLQRPLPEHFRRKLQDPLAWNSLRLDVVQATLPVKNFVISNSRLLLASAVGIAFDPVAAFAFTPEQLMGRCLMTEDHQLSVTAISNLITESNLWSAWKLWTQMASATTGFNVNLFESDSYYADATTACRLFRGHPVRQIPGKDDVLREEAVSLAFRLRGLLNENGRYERPFLEWLGLRADGKAAIWEQSQLVLALVKTAQLRGLTEAQRKDLLAGAAAAVKPILKSIKHFDEGELRADFATSTEQRKPASQRLYAAVVEDENVEGDYEPSENQMAISRRLMELEASANAYLALATVAADFPTGDDVVRACRAELSQLMRYILTQIQPNGDFVPARIYPDGQMALDYQPEPEQRAEIISLCGLAMGRHAELFPDEAAKLNLVERTLMLRNTLAGLVLENRSPDEYPLTPWLAEFLAQDAGTNPARLAQLMRLALAASNDLEKEPFLPDMFGAPTAIPSMTFAAERLWLVCVAAEAIGRQGGHGQEALEVLREAWPLAVYAQQAKMDAAAASALPRPDGYLGFYRDNLADYGFTMNGQTTQLLVRLKLLSGLEQCGISALEALPEAAAAYEACWTRLEEHPVALAPELVIRSAISSPGNERSLGGSIDTSRMRTGQYTLREENGQPKGKKNSGKDSRVLRRKK